MFDVSDLVHRSMHELSEGQRQKIYLAMALVQDTPTIFMDEPTNFLDVSHQLRLMTLSRKLVSEGKCIVMVLHDIRLAMQYSDEFIVLHNGTIQGIGTADEIFQQGIIDQVFHIRLSRMESSNRYNATTLILLKI